MSRRRIHRGGGASLSPIFLPAVGPFAGMGPVDANNFSDITYSGSVSTGSTRFNPVIAKDIYIASGFSSPIFGDMRAFFWCNRFIFNSGSTRRVSVSGIAGSSITDSGGVGGKGSAGSAGGGSVLVYAKYYNNSITVSVTGGLGGSGGGGNGAAGTSGNAEIYEIEADLTTSLSAFNNSWNNL